MACGWGSSGRGASKEFPASQRARTPGTSSVVDESQKRIPLRLLDIAVEKVDPAFAPMVNADQSGTTIEEGDFPPRAALGCR
jgi:hypothetical protein